MSRITIAFRLPEDREEYERTISGQGAVTVLVEALRHIRTRLDDCAANDARAELEEIQRVIVEEARDRRVPID